MLEFDPSIDYALLLAVPLIPLVGYALQIAFRKRLPFGDKILTAGMFAVMCITVYMATKAISAAYHGQEFFHESAKHGHVFGWLSQTLPSNATNNISAGILYDSLGAAMLAVVGIVSFCVHLFSTGYMHGDRRYNIFFANISLFTFAMLGLVLSDNILFLFIFWELMGLMSYLLIGHFSHDPSKPFFHRWATWASKKAFLTTRVGDTCLLIGMVMFYYHFETVRFTELWERAREAVEANGGEYPAWMTWAGLLVFGGTVGKSAQFPLHIWLPDAMAGPTPVSAMIHAATMVAAGIFLLGRTFPLMSPEVLTIVTVTGSFTALFAATIGATAFDLKAVLAYSTISQLGFMAAAVGLGGVAAGMFHMVTHAFFKACLFLSAGSVIHGCHHEQDMRQMGGLRKRMPITFACMLICTLAISGVPLFAGFYSKDAILATAIEGVLGPHFDGWKVFALAALALAATLTTFYMFRMVYMTFSGQYRGLVTAGGHGHGHGHAEDAHAAHGHAAAGDAHGHSAQDAHGHGAQHGHAAHGHDAHAQDAHGHDAHGHGSHGHDEHGADDGIAHGHGGPVPKESPLPMVFAISLLGLLGIFGGHFWLADPGSLAFWHPVESWFQHLVTTDTLYPNIAEWLHHHAPHDHELAHTAHGYAFWLSCAIVVVGFSLATLLYYKRRDLPAKITAALGPVYEAVAHKYYIDEIIDALVIKPTVAMGRGLKAVDEKVVDGLVLLIGRIHKALAFAMAWFDLRIVDGLVNFVGLLSQSFGALARLVQTGRVQQYAAFAVGGGLLAAAWLILS